MFGSNQIPFAIWGFLMFLLHYECGYWFNQGQESLPFLLAITNHGSQNLGTHGVT
jgi:hypothetical protein